MKKRNAAKTLSRTSDQRKALLNSLMTSLVEYGQIKTTLAKAKVLRPKAERWISLAIKGLKDKDQRIAKTRLLGNQFCSKTVAKMFKIAEIVKERKGGYLRIIKLPNRESDFASMAKIEWVDELGPESGKKTKIGSEKKDKKEKEN